MENYSGSSWTIPPFNLSGTKFKNYVTTTQWRYAFQVTAGVFWLNNITNATLLYLEINYTQNSMPLATSLELRAQNTNGTVGVWILNCTVGGVATTIQTPYILPNPRRPEGFAVHWFFVDHINNELFIYTLQVHDGSTYSNSSLISDNNIINVPSTTVAMLLLKRQERAQLPQPTTLEESLFIIRESPKILVS